ncbi:MAG TPA: flavin reductase family protein [Noviherbaspirillum sp.]|uniref:flavin reductase family protein n=1 Tax=Noviherbaspirillum sp. TaxID=1926288 RepID=UPI002B4649F2|nr:flavin reductase family protein [Noviherbaspirillum sp.]HJV87607.1 flavin reductase family protein [Noviherbaspirillum sp.]
MFKKPFPLAKVYALIEPGPVVLLTTAQDGQPNVMTLSWKTMLEFEPPLIGCVISNRNYSYDLLVASKECVINIPTVELAKKVVSVGNTTGAKADKFKRFGLTPLPARFVDAPLIDECYACLECRVADTRMVPEYGFFVLEVLQAWVDRAVKDPRTLHHRGYGSFMVAGETIRLRSRMR